MVRLRISLFLLLFVFLPESHQQFCALTSFAKETNPASVDCSVSKMLPTIRTGAASQFTVNQCNVVFILDLGSEFISQSDYEIIMYFINSVASTCMSKGVGYQVTAYPMFDRSTSMTCCSPKMCIQEIGFMPYDIYVPPYGDTSAIVYESNSTPNFTTTLVDELKLVNNKPCAFNSAVMISNRLFASDNQDALVDEIGKISDYTCLTFTQIIVNRGDDISMEDMKKYYGKYSDYQFLVPNINCLDKIASCIAPCGSGDTEMCSSLDLHNCELPTRPTTPPPTTTTTTHQANPAFTHYWHIIYVFALSNRTTSDQFNNIVTYIGDPIMKCKETLVRFLAPKGEDSLWISDLSTVDKYLNDIQFYEIVIPAGPEAYDTETTDLMWKALGISLGDSGDVGDPTPRITLVSDYASQKFIDEYQNNTMGLLLKLEKYDLQIITFSEEVAEIYRNHSFKARDVHVDLNYDPSNPIEICPQPLDPDKDDTIGTMTILFIVIGSCLGLMLLLVVATILFRQKYFWMDRINAMKQEGLPFHHRDDHDDDIIDYWEVSWDSVIVKNDRLGHGAHGQVFRGKLRGKFPGVEHFFRPEERLNYVDCDVAIKMLPAASSDKAREEFLKEIDMMKSIGYNEHIVNMLGCITSHKRVGLILEYCVHGDLARILKARRADLVASRSIDNQIESTKQFLQYGWQIAHGMEFLQKRNIIHRDLAARNVLVDTWGNAKVGDFGLCIRCESHPSPPSTPGPDEKERAQSTTVAAGEGRLPIKWLAIESLQYQKFSHKTDVWSFGIVLFEMYSLGEEPFDDIDPSDLLEHLLNGNRPPRPLIACDKMYEVMTRCWSEDPNARPSFGELLTILAILIEQSTEGYGYLQLIKGSDHYKTLGVPETDEKKRAGSGLSNRSAMSKEKEKDKFIQPWKKLAATLKVRSVFSGPATTQAPPPTVTVTEAPPPRSNTPSDAKRSSIEKPMLLDRLRSKMSFRSPDDLNVPGPSGIPSTSSGGGNTLTVSNTPVTPRSTPKFNMVVRSKILLGRQLSSHADKNNKIQPDENVVPIDFLPNGFISSKPPEPDPDPEPVSICIDGHTPAPISYPRTRGNTRVPSIHSEDSDEYLEDFGRWSFHRRSLKRHQSMPGRRSIDTGESIGSGSNSRKISRISRISD